MEGAPGPTVSTEEVAKAAGGAPAKGIAAQKDDRDEHDDGDDPPPPSAIGEPGSLTAAAPATVVLDL